MDAGCVEGLSEVCLSSRQLAAMGQVAVPLIEQLLAAGRLTGDAAVRLKVAVQEAVSNALEHGNLELLSAWKEQLLAEGEDLFSVVRRQRLRDPVYAEKTVTVRAWCDPHALVVEVVDEGQGFIRQGALERQQCGVCVSGEVHCSGRGLTLMENGVDEVRFSQNGALVRLIKYLR